MCEYCGCQALPEIRELTREHEFVVDLISDVHDAHRVGDVPAVAALARRIARVLQPHTRVEEDALFPALAEEFPQQIATLEAEHRRVEAVLAEAEASVPTASDWPERLLAVLHLLRDHILKEQDGVFPAALAGLSIAQWELVDAVRAQVGSAIAPDAPRGTR